MLPESIWAHAWFNHWQHYGVQILNAWQEQPEALHACLAAKQTDYVAVPQTTLPTDEAYEAFIYRTHTVPTRNNAHDFFNGLAWLRFPRTKQQLNRLQAQAIQQEGVTSQRGALRDALTLFDENAALLCAPEVLWQALQAQDWQALFVTHRAAWKDAHLTLFGHALLEKLLKPYKSITMAKPSKALRLSPLAVRNWLTPSKLATIPSTSITAKLVTMRRKTRFMKSFELAKKMT